MSSNGYTDACILSGKTMMEGKTYTLKAGKVAHDAGIGP
jgi:hypothetical protein